MLVVRHVWKNTAIDHTKKGIHLRLEVQFNTNYELVSYLRRRIRVQKVKKNIIKMGWISLIVLLVYAVLVYFASYIIP
jgi:hypothetical protein